MHPINKLKRLLQENNIQQGTLLSINDSSLTISTSTGVKTIARSQIDATHYSVGDTIVTANGVLIGRRRNNDIDIYVL